MNKEQPINEDLKVYYLLTLLGKVRRYCTSYIDNEDGNEEVKEEFREIVNIIGSNYE